MKNAFSVLLKDLINYSGVKNINIAIATGYDLSYISKWLSGTMLPSEKTIQRTADSIAKCIYESFSDETKPNVNREWFVELFGETISATLISEKILKEYFASKEKELVEVFDFFPCLNIHDICKKISKILDSQDDAVVMINLFSLDKDSRMEILGIKEGNFCREFTDRRRKVDIVIYQNGETERIYNGLSMIHLISAFSSCDFNLYLNESAANNVLAVLNGKCAISGSLLNNKGKDISLISMVSNNLLCEKVYSHVIKSIQAYNGVFLKQSMDSFIKERYYLKSMLSTNVRWILGHITELMLPDEMFNMLMNQTNLFDPDYFRIHEIAKTIIEQETTSILIYETAITDFLATGEVDFFNKRVVLSSNEKIRFIDYLINLLEDSNIRLIGGAFYSEFQHVFNPALFLSDSVCYMRVEKAYNRENIYEIVDERCIDIFDKMFEGLWNSRKDVVINDKKIISLRFNQYREIGKLIS